MSAPCHRDLGSPPEIQRQGYGVDLNGRPPGCLVAVAAVFAVIEAENLDGELVADFSAKRSGLGEAQVMGLARGAPADYAALPRDELEMLLVARPDGLAIGRQTGFGAG